MITVDSFIPVAEFPVKVLFLRPGFIIHQLKQLFYETIFTLAVAADKCLHTDLLPDGGH